MPERSEIILHAGFHETGHRTIQQFAQTNFKDHSETQFIFGDQLDEASRFARDYSKSEDPITVGDLIDVLGRALPTSGRIVLSAEDLSGARPGTPQIRDYSALLVLMPTYIEFLTEHFANAHIRVLLTERNSEDWLFAVYRRVVSEYRQRLTFAEFQAAYFEASQLTDFADALQDLIHPIPLTRLDFDTLNAHPLGIGGGFFEALGFDVDGCTPVATKEQSAEVWHECLRLNRSTLTNQEVRAAKDALLKA